MDFDGFVALGIEVAVGVADGSAVGETSGGGGVISGIEAVGLGASVAVGETLGLGSSIAVGAGVGAGGGGAGAGSMR